MCDSVYVCMCMDDFFPLREKAKKVWKQTSKNRASAEVRSLLVFIQELRAETQRLIAGDFFFFLHKAIDSQTLKIGEQRGTITTWLSGDKMETRAGTLISLTYFLSLQPGAREAL